jgi:hypothetical protein
MGNISRIGTSTSPAPLGEAVSRMVYTMPSLFWGKGGGMHYPTGTVVLRTHPRFVPGRSKNKDVDLHVIRQMIPSRDGVPTAGMPVKRASRFAM